MTIDATALSWESSLTSWNRGLACLAAGVLVTRSSEASDRVPADLLAAARAVLDATGLDPAGAPPGAQLEASLLQAAGIINPSGFSWLDQTDEALLAQGLASARTAVLMARHVLPRLEGLTSRLTQPGAAILDVGTGVAALAAALAQEYPAVTVTGLDVSERVLSLASTTLAAHPAAERVQLRVQDVATLDEPDRYDLAWIPAPFIPPAALHAGVRTVAAGLHPGGWLLLGHGRLPDHDPLEAAVTRFVTTAYGGTALTDAEAEMLLRGAGLSDVTTVPTPLLAPSLTAARRPVNG